MHLDLIGLGTQYSADSSWLLEVLEFQNVLRESLALKIYDHLERYEHPEYKGYDLSLREIMP